MARRFLSKITLSPLAALEERFRRLDARPVTHAGDPLVTVDGPLHLLEAQGRKHGCRFALILQHFRDRRGLGFGLVARGGVGEQPCPCA